MNRVEQARDLGQVTVPRASSFAARQNTDDLIGPNSISEFQGDLLCGYTVLPLWGTYCVDTELPQSGSCAGNINTLVRRKKNEQVSPEVKEGVSSRQEPWEEAPWECYATHVPELGRWSQTHFSKRWVKEIGPRSSSFHPAYDQSRLLQVRTTLNWLCDQWVPRAQAACFKHRCLLGAQPHTCHPSPGGRGRKITSLRPAWAT